MAGKATQSTQADEVIGGGGKGKCDGEASELEQLKSQNERLNEELATANAAVKTAGEEAREAVFAFVGEELVKRKVVTQAEAAAEDFGPIATLFSAFDDVTAERNALKRSLAAQKGATTRKVNEIEELEASLKPRKLGPIEDQLKPGELAELLAGTPRVEIAFSDGKHELVGVPPVSVPGECFTFRRGRLLLDVEQLMVRGPADERGARVLAGYALLIDAEQVAWLPRMGGELTLGAGQTYQLKGDVVLT